MPSGEKSRMAVEASPEKPSAPQRVLDFRSREVFIGHPC